MIHTYYVSKNDYGWKQKLILVCFQFTTAISYHQNKEGPFYFCAHSCLNYPLLKMHPMWLITVLKLDETSNASFNDHYIDFCVSSKS